MKWKKSLFCHRSLLSLSSFSLLFCRPKLSNKEKKVTEVLSFFYYLPHRVVFVCACVSRLPTNFLTFAALWRRKEKKKMKREKHWNPRCPSKWKDVRNPIRRLRWVSLSAEAVSGSASAASWERKQQQTKTAADRNRRYISSTRSS